MMSSIDSMGGRVLYASSLVSNSSEADDLPTSTSTWFSYGQFVGRCMRSAALFSFRSREHGHHIRSSTNPAKRYAYDTCIVVDCSQWLDIMASYTKAWFPDVDIRVVHSASSLSGFCVVMKLPTPGCHDHQHHLGALQEEEDGDDEYEEEEDEYCMVHKKKSRFTGGTRWIFRLIFQQRRMKTAAIAGAAVLGCILFGACYAVWAIRHHHLAHRHEEL